MTDLKKTDQLETPEPASADKDRLVLVAITGEGAFSFPLPREGQVVIGRSQEADVTLDTASISRRHVLLEVGAVLRVRDLGSSNGTRVRQRKLLDEEWADISPGEVIEIGAVMAVIQKNPRLSPQRRLWTHGYFEMRLEDECCRGKGQFAVVRLHVTDRAVSEARVGEALARELRPTDCLAVYGPGEYETLLCATGPESAARRSDELLARLEEEGISACAGLACYPRDGRDPERLLAHACGKVQGQRPASGGVQAVVGDPAMVQLYALIDRVARGNINVLVTGETGVGKELIAEAVHRRSPRSANPFVRINCAAFTETLLESELFGHEKGAFTGAAGAKAGLLEAATGGSVLLDEVGELNPATQSKLLRALEEKMVRPVGAVKPRPVDVRFIAATNRDLECEVEQGRFRKDLYFRLAGVTLYVPPLRERVREIAPLAAAFAAEAARQLERSREPGLSGPAIAKLEQYAWPGNVRELRNVVERAVLLCEGDCINLEHLPLEKMRAVWIAAPPPSSTAASQPRSDQERERIAEALRRSGGNQTQAAKLLGISRRTLLYWLDDLDLPRPQKKAPSSGGA